MSIELILMTKTLTKYRLPFSSERAFPMDRTGTFKRKISGHETQTGLDTKTDRMTDHQSQCDFDSDFDLLPCYLDASVVVTDVTDASVSEAASL
jgi:hypothetical protein